MAIGGSNRLVGCKKAAQFLSVADRTLRENWLELRVLHGFCVYCLYGDDEDCPFYVGSSRNVHGRIGQHVSRFGQEIMTVKVMRCESEQAMYDLERELIDAFQPVHNIEGRTGQRHVKGYWSAEAVAHRALAAQAGAR